MHAKKPRSRGKPKRPQNIRKFDKGPHVSSGSRMLEGEWRASGVSMAMFAKRIGVHRVSVFRWISGKVKPGMDTAFHMEKVLQIPARAWNEK